MQACSGHSVTTQAYTTGEGDIDTSAFADVSYSMANVEAKFFV